MAYFFPMLTDVIAALATPPGRSAVALLRVSGRGSHAVVATVLHAFRGEPARAARLTKAIHPGTSEVLDEVLYTTFLAPSSYTGEDMVEISTHGGLLAPAEVLGALLVAGARQAEPGEFTRRAMEHGKLDLLQAEAVADLTAATAPAQRRAAINQLDQGLSRTIGDLRTQVLDLEALCGYAIDFPEEDDGPVPPAQIDQALDRVEETLTRLLKTAGEGERLQEGAVCVIAGRPNAGKSSLFNSLLGRERAIVTETPGTTRDAIEASVTCADFPFRLIDTAGLRESTDVVERLGVEVSHRYLAAADVVLMCVESGRGMRQEEKMFLDQLAAPTILVRTKSDVKDVEGSGSESDGEVAVSALTGRGLASLRQRLAAVAFSQLGSSAEIDSIVTRERHRIALGAALCELRDFRTAREKSVDVVVATTHLRAAVSALDDVIGVVTPEEVLGRVFTTFCVGK